MYIKIFASTHIKQNKKIFIVWSGKHFCHPYLFKVPINCIVQDALAVSFVHHYEGINLFQGKKSLTTASFQHCLHLFIHSTHIY